MRSHNFASQGLRAYRRLAQGLELLALLVELLNHVALVGCRLGKQPLEGVSLVGTLVGELTVRGLLLLELHRKAVSFAYRILELLVQSVDLLLLILLSRPHIAIALFCEHPLKKRGVRHFAELYLKPLDFMLMRSLAIAELDLQPVSLGCHVLQPRSQILKMCSALQEKLFELLLRGEAALQLLALGHRLLERLLQAKQLLLSVGGSAGQSRLSVAAFDRDGPGRLDRQCRLNRLNRLNRLDGLNWWERPQLNLGQRCLCERHEGRGRELTCCAVCHFKTVLKLSAHISASHLLGNS